MRTIKLTARQEQLFAFVSKHHGDQVRKYTGEPYTEHLLNVATMVPADLVEVALCHDLFEDTECSSLDLFDFLLNNGYDGNESDFICDGVHDLTDYYTKERCPDLNRAARKKLEAVRLGKISHTSQTVKYADLINNTSSIAYLDPGFAVTYMREKREILDQMRDGNIDLLIKCCATYQAAMEHLEAVANLESTMPE
jgi:guanosine-3',5'-bis(diphosphate) 3'-pyrophosphohydrolase